MAKGNTVRLWRRSLIVLMVMLIAGFGLLIFRLVQLQIVEGETLQKGAVSQQLKDTTISAKRGTIYDCNMKPLAQSANVIIRWWLTAWQKSLGWKPRILWIK